MMIIVLRNIAAFFRDWRDRDLGKPTSVFLRKLLTPFTARPRNARSRRARRRSRNVTMICESNSFHRDSGGSTKYFQLVVI
jgi:hypothetical protein